MKASLAKQTAILAYTFPIGCKVQTLPEKLPGRVEGYRKGGHIKRLDEMALIVNVPGDTWILYPNQVKRIEDPMENTNIIFSEELPHTDFSAFTKKVKKNAQTVMLIIGEGKVAGNLTEHGKAAKKELGQLEGTDHQRLTEGEWVDHNQKTY